MRDARDVRRSSSCPACAGHPRLEAATDLHTEDVDAHGTSPWAEGPPTKSGHWDPFWLHRIVSLQPPPIHRTACPGLQSHSLEPPSAGICVPTNTAIL